jgi:hypothetical protein
MKTVWAIIKSTFWMTGGIIIGVGFMTVNYYMKDRAPFYSSVEYAQSATAESYEVTAIVSYDGIPLATGAQNTLGDTFNPQTVRKLNAN